jgi:hypothetical protein
MARPSLILMDDLHYSNAIYVSLAHVHPMQIERIAFTDDDEVSLFWYEPTDVSPTTHVFGRWEDGIACGPCAGISLIYLINSVDDFTTAFSSLRHGANDLPTGANEGLYVNRHVDAFNDGLRALAASNGGSLAGISGDEVKGLLGELSKHVFLATPGMEITGASLEGHGTMVDYLADGENQKLLLAMLGRYCDEPDWQNTPGPDADVVGPRLKGKTALVLPGDEDLVALAINLYNNGAYEEVSV